MPTAFAQRRVGAPASAELDAFERVEQLHRARDDGVVLHALVVVARPGCSTVCTSRRSAFARARPARRRAAPAPRMRSACLRGEVPDAAQEAVRAFDAASFHSSVCSGGAANIDEQARGVGAVLVDQVLRVDAVVLRLRHLLDAADLDRLAVGLAASRRPGGPCRRAAISTSAGLNQSLLAGCRPRGRTSR